MATKVVCPDCGGVIGELETGEKPCTCFATPQIDPNPSKSDTATIDPKSVDKVCLVCGKDVRGHRRVKDSRGYMCYACAKAERKAEKEGKLKCKLCRKLVKPAGLVALNGKMVCRKCFGDYQETARFKKKVSTKHYESHDKVRLIILAVIAGVLAMFVLASLIKRGFFGG
jgi:hypothetical protein